MEVNAEKRFGLETSLGEKHRWEKSNASPEIQPGNIVGLKLFSGA